MIKAIFKSLMIVVTLLPLLSNSANVSELNPIELLKVKSSYFKNAIEYNVTLPASYNEAKGKDKKYFVVFDLHPRSQPYLSGIHDWLSHNGEWPWLESIVITPAKYNKEFSQIFEKIVSDPTDQTVLNFFESDLFPTLDKKYRTNGFRIYSGFMGNGALGLYTLLNRPNLFNAYIISSPSLSDDFGKITSQAKEKLAKLDNKMRFLYLATGEHQYEQGNLPSFDLFAESLKSSSKSLDWQVHHDNKNYYMSRPVLSVINGIQALFDDIHTSLKADSAISKKGPQAIIDHYKMLSTKKYGFDVSAEDSLKVLAKSLMDNEPKKALAIYQQITELYPESAYAWSSLAKTYADLDDIDQAIKYQSIAVEKSKTMVKWHQNKHQQYLDEFILQRDGKTK